MSKQLQQAVALYESFRERSPKKLATIRVSIPKVVANMGYVQSLDYLTTHKGKAQPYRHKFAKGSRPLLCVSADGRQLMLLGGHYKWTDRGIVDHDAKGRERPDPKHGRTINPKRRKRNPAYEQREAHIQVQGFNDGVSGKVFKPKSKWSKSEKLEYKDGYLTGEHQRRNYIFNRSSP